MLHTNPASNNFLIDTSVLSVIAGICEAQPKATVSCCTSPAGRRTTCGQRQAAADLALPSGLLAERALEPMRLSSNPSVIGAGTKVPSRTGGCRRIPHQPRVKRFGGKHRQDDDRT